MLQRQSYRRPPERRAKKGPRAVRRRREERALFGVRLAAHDAPAAGAAHERALRLRYRRRVGPRGTQRLHLHQVISSFQNTVLLIL